MKKEKNQENEKVIVIDINLTRGLAIVLAAALLLAAAALGILAWGQREAAAASPQAPASSAGMRQYYLTKGVYDGNDPTGTDGNGAGVCAAGYHFASLWEIIDTSNLKYNTDLGYTAADSGQGPPTFVDGASGWVRTGYSSNTSDTPGMGNCGNWTLSSAQYGTLATLDYTWDTSGPFTGWVLSADLVVCGQARRVWCVED